jgi:small nuclear ribonucleoprotein (snRNP)-like protein
MNLINLLTTLIDSTLTILIQDGRSVKGKLVSIIDEFLIIETQSNCHRIIPLSEIRDVSYDPNSVVKNAPIPKVFEQEIERITQTNKSSKKSKK